MRISMLLWQSLVLLLWSAAALAAERIVTVGGDVTEIVFALDMGQPVIAVDSTSTYPPAADALPDVGYLRRLSAEPIMALEPDLVLASESAGPPPALRQLRDAGIRVETVPDEPSVEGVRQKIEHIAGVLDRDEAGEALADAVEGELAAVEQALAGVDDEPRVLFLLSVGRGAPLSGGRETSVDAILRLAGAENAVTGFSGYKPLSAEAALQAKPQVLLVPTHTLEAVGGAERLLELPQVALTPAARERRIVNLDGLLLLGFGPRIGEAAARLARALHPDLDLDLPGLGIRS